MPNIKGWLQILEFIFVFLQTLICYNGLFNTFGYTQAQEIHKASQCFKSPGIPKVSFECNPDEMIQIHKAYHGIAQDDRSSCFPDTCSFCDGDCIDDSMNLVYDWSTCMGNTSCVRTVMQSYMPACQGRDKFSDYLQVEYQCIPRTEVIDICSDTSVWITEGYLMSPGYPEHYPINQDCECTIQTDWNSRIIISFFDLLLETKQVSGFSGRCRADWLMLRQKNQKHRHCGAIMTGTKNMTSEDNTMALQFHTDQYDNKTQNFQYFSRTLKGFWLHIKAEPEATMQVQCRRLSDTDPSVREIYDDDADYNEILSTRVRTGQDVTTVAGTEDIEGNNEEEGNDNAQGNEVDAQGGTPTSIASHHYSNFIATITTVVMAFKLTNTR